MTRMKKANRSKTLRQDVVKLIDKSDLEDFYRKAAVESDDAWEDVVADGLDDDIW